MKRKKKKKIQTFVSIDQIFLLSFKLFIVISMHNLLQKIISLLKKDRNIFFSKKFVRAGFEFTKKILKSRMLLPMLRSRSPKPEIYSIINCSAIYIQSRFLSRRQTNSRNKHAPTLLHSDAATFVPRQTYKSICRI